MNITRRGMLKLGAGAAALWAAGVELRGGPQEATTKESKVGKKIPIGLQLYSLREDCPKDLPGTLKAVAAMGYVGVEFAGYHGRKADELRKMLTDNGLKCCGTHTGLDTLTGDALKSTAEYNRALGNKFLIVPSLPPKNTESVRALTETAKLFTELAGKAKELGMCVGYHAHAGDLKPLDGQVPWDVIFSNTGRDVVMQLDTANCLAGGGDPVAILKKYPGRSTTIHLKEFGGKKGCAIGEGEVKWREVFEVCETTGGTEWYIVEQEVYDGTPLDCVKRCLENLRKMGK